jgi:hypothetical protein
MKKTTSPSAPSTSPRERMQLRRLTLRRLTASEMDSVVGGLRVIQTGEAACHTLTTFWDP